MVVYEEPVWKTPVPRDVEGKIVSVVDEIADTGQTLSMVANRAIELGAHQVVTASLVAHSWANPAPNLFALLSDEFIIFPWEKQVLVDGKWINHPEIEAGLNAQT